MTGRNERNFIGISIIFAGILLIALQYVDIPGLWTLTIYPAGTCPASL